MAIPFLTQLDLAEDAMWILRLENPDRGALQFLLDKPEEFLAQFPHDLPTPVRFNPTLPIDILISFDLADSDPWVVQGVHKTNLITVRAPQTVRYRTADTAGEAARFGPTAAAPSEEKAVVTPSEEEAAATPPFFRLDNSEVEIVLVEAPRIAYAHFDPASQSIAASGNFAGILVAPSELPNFLDTLRLAGKHQMALRNLDTKTSTSATTPVQFSIAANVTIRWQIAACFPVEGGNCVKKYGVWEPSLLDGSDASHFVITHIEMIPYCTPPT